MAGNRKGRLSRASYWRRAGVGKTLQFPNQYRHRNSRRYRNARRDGSRTCACRRWAITKMGNSPDWTQPDRGGNRMTDNRDRVAVLMGGWTSEAAVSRVSASFCGQAARNAGWDAIEVEVDRDIAAKLKELNPSRDRKSTRLNSSHIQKSRMPSSA